MLLQVIGIGIGHAVCVQCQEKVSDACAPVGVHPIISQGNPLRSLGARVVFHGTNYRTFVLTVPFGDKPTATFGAPHALGNINYYEPFLKKFKEYMEDPEKIPQELLEKPYKQAPAKDGAS